ncbi:MAG: MATE family efflux transporter [Gemmatimonadaceae bacterium]|jgi:putative MATE family efflux protein|nr:MATE family efflux transporter [Gemmatimonadaceae bacterium]
MQDLTQGPIPRHIIRMAVPMAAGMIFQTLYYLIDLYFVARLGDAAIAGVGAAGTLQFIIMAITQVLGVGTTALIAQAAGRRDRDDATRVLNQSLLLAAVAGGATLLAGVLFSGVYMRSVAADGATVAAGTAYLRWFAPSLALSFAMITLGSALRGTGITRPMMIVQIVTVVLNAALAPVLIAGWGTGRALGVAGAGIATFISVAIGVVLSWYLFYQSDPFARVVPAQLRPNGAVLKRIFTIGLPAGGEFALMFIITGLMYWIIRPFGATAQAGYGLGTRLMQSIFLPAMAVAFAASPVAGQNVGAGLADRVRETFRSAALIGSIVMVGVTILVQVEADTLLGLFTSDAAVIAVGAGFLHVISWNFVSQGLIFTASGMFQALGNTIPSLISSGVRITLFAVPAIWFSGRADFSLHTVWWWSVATVTIQMLLSVWLVRREMTRRLAGMVPRGRPDVVTSEQPVAA